MHDYPEAEITAIVKRSTESDDTFEVYAENVDRVTVDWLLGL